MKVAVGLLLRGEVQVLAGEAHADTDVCCSETINISNPVDNQSNCLALIIFQSRDENQSVPRSGSVDDMYLIYEFQELCFNRNGVELEPHCSSLWMTNNHIICQ